MRFNKTHTALQSNPPAGASLSMQASSLRYFVALLLPTPPGYTKKQPQPRLFLYTGESVRLNKNAHCFAVEPSRLTLRFRCKHLRFAIASRRSFRLPPGTPKNNRNRGCFCIRGGRTLRLTASEERSKRLHLRKSNAADIANNRTQSVKCKALARMRGC